MPFNSTNNVQVLKKYINKLGNLQKRERTIFVDNDEHTTYAPVKLVVNTETLSHNSPD